MREIKAKDAARQEVLEQELCLSFLRLTDVEVITLDDEALTARVAAAVEEAAKKVPEWGARLARRR